MPLNFVYLNPTIERLGRYVARIGNQGDESDMTLDGTAATIAEMNGLVARYTKYFAQHRPTDQLTVTLAEVVLLTGSTGGLGSYILEALVLNPSISRIYALNRQDKLNRSSRERQRATFEDRGVDITILESQKVVFLDGDSSLDMLGLSLDVYEELRTDVTCIIHCGTFPEVI